MADNDIFEDDDDVTPKDLRKQLAKEKKEKQDLLDRLATLEKQGRQRSIADVLSEKGYSPKLANFVPDSVEADGAALSAWLEENAEIFGAPKTTPADTSIQDEANAELATAHQRMAAATEGGEPAGKPQNLKDQLLSPELTKEALDALVLSAGATQRSVNQ